MGSPSSNLQKRKRSNPPGDEALPKKQKLRPEETALELNVSVVASPEKPPDALGVLRLQDAQNKERHDPIGYWVAHHIWPKGFTQQDIMASESTNKRRRASDQAQSNVISRSQSYSQSRREGAVPEAYSAKWQQEVLIMGLDMDYFKGDQLVSAESKKLCIDLQRITHKAIEPTIFPNKTISNVIHYCQNRNEAIVNRDITPIIVPSITSLYFGGENGLEHVVDEVNAGWNGQCVLAGPRIHPDLAIGLFPSAFTEEEMEKLKRYTSVDNWTQITTHMCFPFLMCEVKCGREGLDVADRQNMHSCCVAVKALLRIEQEADKYRSEKELDRLFSKVLVFSISHDQQDARLYGHFAIAQGQKWTYYRYRIRKFDLTDYDSVLTLHNFVRNTLKSFLPGHVRRLKEALAALPDPNEMPESVALTGSTGLSFAASEVSLNQGNSQEAPRVRDADGFLVPARPSSSQSNEAGNNEEQSRLIEKLIEENMRLRQRQDLGLIDKLIEENMRLRQRQDLV